MQAISWQSTRKQVEIIAGSLQPYIGRGESQCSNPKALVAFSR